MIEWEVKIIKGLFLVLDLETEFEELKSKQTKKPSILSGIFKKAKEDIEKTLKKLDNY